MINPSITESQSQSAPAHTRGDGPPLPAVAGGGESPLPCLYSNNCIETSARPLTSEEIQAARSAYITLSPYSKKQADRLYRNTERLISLAPSLGHVAFFTLTFPDKVYSHKEATRRWHSLNTNYLKPHPEFGMWERVDEQHKDGAWHFHCLIHVAQDIRTGFDFDEYLAWLKHHKDKKPGSPRLRLKTGSIYLRSLWADLRQNLQKYKFGISELIPLRKNEEAVARYVGKYISKHMSQRTEKGARIVAYSGDWVKHSMKMAWYNINSILWRYKVALFAQYHGCTEFYQLADKLGPKWAYMYTDEIDNIENLLEENGGVCCPAHQDKITKKAKDRKVARYRREFEPPADPEKRKKWEEKRELSLISRKPKAQRIREAARNHVNLILTEKPVLPALPDPPILDERDFTRERILKLDVVNHPDVPERTKPQPEGVPF